MSLPNSVGSFIATLPQRSATQPQGPLAAQVGQACLGAFIPAVPVPGMPLSQTSVWPAFSHSVLSSNITSEAFPDHSPTPALYTLLTLLFLHISNQNP